MTEKIDGINLTPDGGETKQDQIIQSTGGDIHEIISGEQQDESKEVQTLPNVIICRRYYDDKQNDMQALQSQLPEILNNITYLHDPRQIVNKIKSDAKNIIFVGQYFDCNMTGTQLASEIKSMGLDTEISLITSIDVPYSQRSSCDRFYQISKSMNKSDGANIIVQHLQNIIKKKS